MRTLSCQLLIAILIAVFEATPSKAFPANPHHVPNIPGFGKSAMGGGNPPAKPNQVPNIPGFGKKITADQDMPLDEETWGFEPEIYPVGNKLGAVGGALENVDYLEHLKDREDLDVKFDQIDKAIHVIEDFEDFEGMDNQKDVNEKLMKIADAFRIIDEIEKVKENSRLEDKLEQIQDAFNTIDTIEKIKDKDRLDEILKNIRANLEKAGDKPHLLKKVRDQIANLFGPFKELRGLIHEKRKPGVKGDPHIMTFDGRRYNFQGLCWYTLVKSCNSQLPDFGIKARFDVRYVDPEVKTRTVEVMLIDGLESVTLKEDNSIFVNGKPMGYQPLKNIHVTKQVDEVTATLTGAGLTVSWSGPQHLLSVSITDPKIHGGVCGLLGNADDKPENDFQKSDGTLTIDVNEFGNSWKDNLMTC